MRLLAAAALRDSCSNLQALHVLLFNISSGAFTYVCSTRLQAGHWEQHGVQSL